MLMLIFTNYNKKYNIENFSFLCWQKKIIANSLIKPFVSLNSQNFIKITKIKIKNYFLVLI